MNNNPNRVFDMNEQGLNSFFRKVYGFMAIAVGISAAISYVVAGPMAEIVLPFFAQNRFAVWILFILQIGLVFGMSFKANRSPQATMSMLFLYAALEGLFFATIVRLYSSQNITMAFVSASVVFLTLSVMGRNTNKDLSGIGRHAMGALIALVVVSLINLFLQSSIISFFFSIVGVLIFSALTAWDTQNIKRMYLQYGGSVNETNLALMGSLQLYLDFINLFISLLNIFTGINGNKN